LATKVFESIELELLNGDTVEVKPLSLKNLRSLMTVWTEGTQKTTSEDEFLDLLITCTAIAFKQFAPKLAEDRDALEEALDLQTMYKILEVAADIKLNDPKLLEVAQELAGMS
jgi:hypothetical protein